MNGNYSSLSFQGALKKVVHPFSCFVVNMLKGQALKRLIDIILSVTMILLSVPLGILVAIAIKAEDGGPVFFVQDRWGKGKSIFRALKFRSMLPGADRDCGIVPAGENDLRVSKVGRILRATGLDEFPQILNVFLGDMSFVGPRPLAVGEIVTDKNGRNIQYEDIPSFQERLAVRPGLTGIAAIYLSKDSPPEQKFRYDLLYIKKQTFCLDVRLLFITLWLCCKGKWETRGKKL